ncbi:MAG: GldG family protein [Proteobacteria bacterium]|nr:GldG family protein [Pseudomonadota bacterium]
MSLSKIILRLLQSLNTIVVLVLVILVAGLSEQFHTSWDWTANSRNSLSPRSQQIIEQLDGPLEIIVAHSQRAEEAGVKPKIEDLMARYTKAKDDLQIQYINSTLNPQLAQEMGVSQEVELRLNYAGRTSTVTQLSESEISNTILRMMRDKKVGIYWLEHNLQSQTIIDPNPGGLKLFADSLKEDGIDLESVNLVQTPNLHEKNPDLLIVSSPSSALFDKEVDKIDKYILAGGNALILLEPGQEFGLDTLLLDYGIKVNPGVVLDFTGAIMAGSELFVIIQSFQQHPVLSRIQRALVLPRTGSLDYTSMTNADGWERKFLLRSSQNTFLQSFDEATVPQGEQGGDLPVALVMTRELDEKAQVQALKEGISLKRPSAGADSVAEADEDNAINDLLDGGRTEQRVIVIANARFIRNQHIGSAGNLNFARDAVNWLSSNDNLLNITHEKAGDQVLNVDKDGMKWIFAFWGGLLPLAFLATGGLIFIRRRRLGTR